MTTINNNLIEPDYTDAYDQWRESQTPTNNAAMLNVLRPDIDKAIRTHVGRVDPMLRSKGRLMALEAVRSYDPTRGRLKTHLYNHLRGMKRWAGQQSQAVKVPERVVLDRRAMDLAGQELNDDLGREPTDDELAAKTGFSMKRLAHVRKLKPSLSEGFFSQVGPGGFMPGVETPESQAWLDFIYDDLSEIDKIIMEYSLGMNGKPVLDNQSIAAKLNRTPGAISQRKQLIQQLLDQEQELSPF